MTFVQTADQKQRLWNGLGGVLFGDDSAGEVDFHITSRAGQVVIDTRPAPVIPSTVVANVGGFGITWPMVLIAGVVAVLALRK